MIGGKIKELRLENKLSLRKLCKLADMAVSNLTLIEQDKVNPSVATLEKLAIALKCNQSDFFNEEIVYTEEEDKNLDCFMNDIINKLMKEGFITDSNNISEPVREMVINAVKLYVERKQRH